VNREASNRSAALTLVNSLFQKHFENLFERGVVMLGFLEHIKGGLFVCLTLENELVVGLGDEWWIEG